MLAEDASSINNRRYFAIDWQAPLPPRTAVFINAVATGYWRSPIDRHRFDVLQHGFARSWTEDRRSSLYGPLSKTKVAEDAVMDHVRDLLLTVDIEIEGYHDLVCKARNPALNNEERSRLLRQGEQVWRRLEKAHRQLAAVSIEVCTTDNVRLAWPSQPPQVDVRSSRMDVR